MNDDWVIDKTAGVIRHVRNGLVFEIENGEVVNIENVSSAIKLGALPGLLREGLFAYENYGDNENRATMKYAPNRPVLSLKKKAN